MLKGSMKPSPTFPCISIPAKKPDGSKGFTLVEMLTAMTILAAIMLFLVQMARMAGDTCMVGQKQVNNLTKARSMMDLIALDAQMGVFRDDLTAFPLSSGSATLAFYTKRAGVNVSGTMRDISLIMYTINTSSTNSMLSRGDMAIGWSDPASVMPFNNTSGFTDNMGSVTLRDTVPGVVGLKVIFIQSDGTVSPVYPTSSGTNPVRALGVALAVIDDQTLKQLSPANLTAMRNALNTAASGTRSIKADWEDYLDHGMVWNNYPKELATGVKILERYVSLQ